MAFPSIVLEINLNEGVRELPEYEIGFVTTEQDVNHCQPFQKPNLEALETPLRIEMALDYLEKSGALTGLKSIRSKEATLEDVFVVHSPYLIDTVRLMSDLGCGYLAESAYASADLLFSSLCAVGGALAASREILSGGSKHAFALIRPPGHHASTSSPGGLCYFNNVAIAVKHAMQDESIKRVSIIDFDNHFGNGTAEIFYADPSVQYISLHEYDYTSLGIGHYEEVGYGEGIGTNINIPLLESTSDSSYSAALDKIVKKAVMSFRPDIIAVSAGYDPHYADPVGNMDIDSRTFWKIGSTIRSLVDSLKLKGSFWVLEGGYNLFTIGPSIHGSLSGLKGESMPRLQDQIEREICEALEEGNEEVIERVLETVSPFLE